MNPSTAPLPAARAPLPPVGRAATFRLVTAPDDFQLGFFFEPSPAAPPSALPSARGAVPVPVEAGDTRPAIGRTAMRARTAVLFSRLQEMGLRGVEQLVLMRTRTVMVSLIGRTLRVHEGYADAPETVLGAVVAFASARNKQDRLAAREVILAHDVERAPIARRQEPPRPGDVAIIAQLGEAHRQLNAQWFGGTLKHIPLRLSGRMATRLGHYDPGSRHLPAEIVMSRRHISRDGWREAMHTLLHEMVHQWQHETGRPVDHGPEFRAKAMDVGITPAARRDVTPLERRKQKLG